jgi:hypothetical protein
LKIGNSICGMIKVAGGEGVYVASIQAAGDLLGLTWGDAPGWYGLRRWRGGEGLVRRGLVSAIVEGVGYVDGVSFEAAGRREVGGGLRWWTWWVELYGTTNFTNGHEWACGERACEERGGNAVLGWCNF